MLYKLSIALLLVSTTLISAAGTINAQEESTESSTVDHPLRVDPTGIEWAFSFDEAFQKARETNRIVVLKPVSYRTRPGSDKLSPSSETQRAVAFVDKRVVDLLNRRFVPYYFDMDDYGALHDPRATAMAKDLYPDIRYLSSMPTPPLLFLTPEGKLLGNASNFLSADALLEKLVEILNENPSFKQLTEEEMAITDPLEKARLYMELRQLDNALNALDRQESSDAYYLRVVIARETKDWMKMKQAFDMVSDDANRNDMELEVMLRYWEFQNLDGMKARGAGIAKDNPRYQEAMYYLGLAYFHSSDSAKAVEIWQNALQHDRDSAWALRLDLAQGLARLDPSSYLSAHDVIPSLLGKKYLCPNGMADLKDRK